ncbi:hypothetical protein [Snuella sedimenti]|uniref:Alpha/beta hydrolase n=1 Tax=Snuella sedimenti TaxID=2798802 RepID=A0A8J7J719_9FLAO|nr:hypothetical protein [Snuella sedimenti]MBJ6369749.1 hypothetical protein [Snuella sedimenti]
MMKNSSLILEKFKEQGVRINSISHSIFGILTSPICSDEKVSKKPLVVLIPAISGTRIGPQRIFVEIARDVATLGYSCYRMDMAAAGDAMEYSSYESENNQEHPLILWYKGYLDAVTSYFSKGDYSYRDYIFLSISLGCEPVLKYAVDNSYTQVIFLSPTYMDYVEKKTVNKRNVRSYYYKLFNKETWIKLIHFQLNWKNIFRNIIPKRKKFISKRKPLFESINIKPQVFSIFGELDKEFEDSKTYWNKLVESNVLSGFEYKLVKGSDHNFFGYQFKKDLKLALKHWLTSS